MLCRPQKVNIHCLLFHFDLLFAKISLKSKQYGYYFVKLFKSVFLFILVICCFVNNTKDANFGAFTCWPWCHEIH